MNVEEFTATFAVKSPEPAWKPEIVELELISGLTKMRSWDRVYVENYRSRMEVSVWKNPSTENEIGWAFCIDRKSRPDRVDWPFVEKVLSSEEFATKAGQRVRCWNVATGEVEKTLCCLEMPPGSEAIAATGATA